MERTPMRAGEVEQNFEGHDARECGEHRTVGSHRAWCFDCGEWCYPAIPCHGCTTPKVRAFVISVAEWNDHSDEGWVPDALVKEARSILEIL